MTAKITHKNPGAIQKIYQRLSELTKKEVAVGYPRGECQAYPDGTPVASVAAWNTYGTSKIPRRDFMALAIPNIKDNAMPIMKEAVSAKTEKERSALMNAAGEEAKKAIQKAITELDTPPNAPGTLHTSIGGTNPNGKKSDNPLIDTGHMRDSTTFIVRDRT